MRDQSDLESSRGAGILVVSGARDSWIVALRCCRRIRSSRCTIGVSVLRNRANHTRSLCGSDRKPTLLDGSGNCLPTPTKRRSYSTGIIFGPSLLSMDPVEEGRLRCCPRGCECEFGCVFGCEGFRLIDRCPNPRSAQTQTSSSSLDSTVSSKARLFLERARSMLLFSMPLYY